MHDAEDDGQQGPAQGEVGNSGNGRGVLVRLGVVVAVLGVGAGGVWGLTHAATPDESPTTSEVPALSVEAADVEPGSTAPVNATIKGDGQQPESPTTETARQQADRAEQDEPSADEITEWAESAGPQIGVPPRAMVAYARGELAAREQTPDCGLSWATLAGIGRVESNHARYGGAELRDDGLPSKPIIGVPLDGSGGNKEISDTDGGELDGDDRVDRAVGPMQFIPSTWARHAADGNGDDKADPQQIDDAVVAAAGYLCSSGRDMTTAKGWWEGLWSYNQSVVYGQKVFGLADEYARKVSDQEE